MRKALAGATALFIAIALSGCTLLPGDPGPNDPMGIQLSGSDLVVVPCSSILAAKIDMLYLGPNPPKDRWHAFFTLRGSLNVSAGERFSMSANAPRLSGTSVRRNPVLTSGTVLGIYFMTADGHRSVANGAFKIGVSGVPHHRWLQSNGSLTKVPCPAAND